MKKRAKNAVITLQWSALLLSACCLIACAGCNNRLLGPRSDSGRTNTHTSLVEIGEHALETGERLEEQGLTRGAMEAYQRALWAFSYHQRLTSESALLLDDVRDRIQHLRLTMQTETK